MKALWTDAVEDEHAKAVVCSKLGTESVVSLALQALEASLRLSGRISW